MIDTGFYTIFWREMLAIRKKFWKVLSGSLVMPVLYLVTFGWGIGRGVRVGQGNYMDFVLPGIIALSAMNSSFNGVSVTLNISKLYYKTIEEILVSPISPWAITLGRILAGCVRGLFSACLIVAIGLVLDVNLGFGPSFFATVLLLSFAFGALGVLAAMLTRSHEDMTNFSNFVILPMAFLSGTFFSPDLLPQPFRSLILVYPLTHGSIALRALATAQAVPLSALAVLFGYAVVLFLLAGLSVKRLEL